MEQILETTKGDLPDNLECTLEDDNGNEIPLPVGETFKLKVYMPVVLEKNYTVVDAPSGRFDFIWADGDTDTAGTFACDIVKFNAAGKPKTFRRVYLLVHDPADK